MAQSYRIIGACATDERTFVKKGANWALRAIGAIKNPNLRTAAREVAADKGCAE